MKDAAKMTDEQRKLIAEMAAVFEADLRVSLEGKAATREIIKDALIETYKTLERPTEFSVERGPLGQITITWIT